jgi:glycosyltransferase involved in cell wall biosynthesis
MNYAPFVSIIVPTYNRPKELKLCVDALLNVEYPMDKYEIIIIDDGSREDNSLMIKEYLKFNKRVVYFFQKNGGPAKARNKGISLSKGKIIIFIDDDVIVRKDLIKRHLAHYENNLIGGVGGQIFPKKMSWADKYYLARYIEEIFYPMIIKNPELGIGLATANCSYRKSVLKEIKGFNEKFPLAAGEDIELSKRVILSGHYLIKDPAIVAEHLRSESFNSTIRLKFKRMSSVVVEERLGTLAKDVGNPYNPYRVIKQWKNFVKLKKEILKEKLKLSDFFAFSYLTIALFFASISGKIYYKIKMGNLR